MRDVVHGRADVRGADAEAFETDRHDGVVGFVVFKEAAEGFDLGGGALDVCPAAGTEGAKNALATGPGVGGDAAELAPWGGFARLGDAGGVDGEEGVGASGGNRCDDRGKGGAGVEFLYRNEGRNIDVEGVWGGVEAKLAGGVVTKGEDATLFVEGEGMVVTCCDGGNFEAAEGDDFVGLIVGACGPGGPGEAGDAHLAAGGEFLTAGGCTEEAAGGGEEEHVFKARRDGENLFVPGQIFRLKRTVADGRGEAQVGEPAAFRRLGSAHLIFLGYGERVDFAIGAQCKYSIPRYR